MSAEENEGGMPNEESLAILRDLAEDARTNPGESLKEHRARFEDRRRQREAKLVGEHGFRP